MINFQYLWPLVFISIFVGSCAKKMGYSSLLWGFVSFLYASPFAALYFMAALPDRKMEDRRKKEMILLKEQLKKRRFLHKNETSNISEQTISDERTIG